MNSTKIAFLYLGQAHDEFPAVADQLAQKGIKSRLVHLDEQVDWGEFSLVSIRHCRGFHLVPDFQSRVERLHEQIGSIPLVNSIRIVRSLLDKHIYLYELEQDGFNTLPTIWARRGEFTSLSEIMANTGWKDLVIKPTASSKSWNTFRLFQTDGKIFLWKAENASSRPAQTSFEHCDELFRALNTQHTICFQRFHPEILTRGEMSFVFIQGRFSHVIQKKTSPHHWVAHEFFGGVNRPGSATKPEIEWAQSVYSRLEQKYGSFLYARIDAIANEEQICLMECESVIPRLFLREGQAVDRYTNALTELL